MVYWYALCWNYFLMSGSRVVSISLGFQVFKTVRLHPRECEIPQFQNLRPKDPPNNEIQRSFFRETTVVQVFHQFSQERMAPPTRSVKPGTIVLLQGCEASGGSTSVAMVTTVPLRSLAAGNCRCQCPRNAQRSSWRRSKDEMSLRLDMDME